MTKPTSFQSMEQIVDIPGRTIPGGWVVGGMTRLLDVWSPSPLVMFAPSICYPDHQLLFTFSQGVSKPSNRGKKAKIKDKIGFPAKQVHELMDSDIFFDCRHDSTANVAHILQNQIGVALAGLKALGIGDRWRDLIFVVPKGTPGYAVRLFEVMGFRVLATSDKLVSGWQVQIKPKKFPLRAIAAKYLRAHALEIKLLSQDDPVGESLFLSRRARRTVTNMDEIESMINKAGFRTLYAEDHSMQDQIRMIANAPRVFALHGAAIGFLMFRNPDQHGVVVECFSCGYATGWARAICSAIGDSWIGGQGDLEAQTVIDLLGDGTSREHEADDYRLEPRVVDALLKATAMSSKQGKHIEALAFEAIVGRIEIDIEPMGEAKGSAGSMGR